LPPAYDERQTNRVSSPSFFCSRSGQSQLCTPKVLLRHRFWWHPRFPKFSMNETIKSRGRIYLTCMTILTTLATFGCSGQDVGFLQPKPEDLCKCLPLEPDIADYRHLAKHVPISNQVPQEVSVDTILTWPQDLFIPPDAPRTGRELEVFHIASAFLQYAAVNAEDCDISMEISQTGDKSAPRMIVETPVDSEYCSARQNLQAQLKQHGFRLDSQHGGELAQGLPMEVVNLSALGARARSYLSSRR